MCLLCVSSTKFFALKHIFELLLVCAFINNIDFSFTHTIFPYVICISVKVKYILVIVFQDINFLYKKFNYIKTCARVLK